MDVSVYTRLCLILVALSVHLSLASFMVKLDAFMTEYSIGDVRIPMFHCLADSIGQNQSYYVDHLITWSKVGRDGREKYLSINWDLTLRGKKGRYMISSDYINPKLSKAGATTVPTTTPPALGTNRKLTFILSKPALELDDHGDYICRLHDFDKNLMAETRVPVVMFDKQLALSPYTTEADSKSDVAVNCMFNTTGVKAPNKNSVVLYHVTKKGKSKRIAKNGKLARKSLRARYSVSSMVGPDKLQNNILTIKAITKKDEGSIKCEMRRGKKLLTSTTADITVDTPKLLATPTFYLQMPVDSLARFKCACAPSDVKFCRRFKMAWSFTNKHTGNTTIIYKDGKVLADPMMYEVIKGKNGSLNLTINGVREIETEGEYICWLHKKGSSTEIAHMSIPVSVTPIAMGVMTMMDSYPASIKILCTVTGTQWDQHYLETHSIGWLSLKNGTNSTIAVNSKLASGIDAKRHSVIYFSSRYYSILVINDITEADYGEYMCQLLKNKDNTVIKEETLSMYGKGNTTVFAGNYATGS